MKTRIAISLLLLATLFTFQNCKDCVESISTDVLGKWQLEKIVTANSTITTFDKPQYLLLAYITTLPTSGGKGFTQETVLAGDSTVSEKTWENSTENCKRKELSVTYKDQTSRDFKLIYDGNTPSSMQVSNYNFVGSSAMPATYYYFRVK